MTREEIKRKIIERGFTGYEEYLLSECERLEQCQKWIDEVARPDHPDDERPWCAAYLDCRAGVKELVDGIERHRAMNMKVLHSIWDDELYKLIEIGGKDG